MKRHANHRPLLTLLLFTAAVALLTAAVQSAAPRIGSADSAALLRSAAITRVIDGGAFHYAPAPLSGSAQWVAGWIDGDERRASRLKIPFYADPNLPDHLRARPADYERAGLDRGHLLADRFFGDADGKQAAANLSNVVPEDPAANRGAIRRCEQACGELATPGVQLLVVAVPIYQWREQPPAFIGPRHVAVPTAVALCALVYDKKTGQPTAAHAWLIPNQPGEYRSIENFETTIDTVEELAWLDLFSFLPDELEDRLEAGTPAK